MSEILGTIDVNNYGLQSMVAGGGSQPNLQSKDVTINQNGTTTITADTGYDGLSDVDVTVSGILDTSDATATANDIAKDKTAYVSGQKITGTYEGPEPVQEKDVNFYDYDGAVVASYTANEFANLSALPANPTHVGLTSQGWNWTLADAKTYVATYGKLNIGQMYITDDGATRIYIKLEEGRLEPYLGFAIDGTATVDWGDNTTSTVTGTDTTTAIFTQHTYASAGEYVISISSESDIVIRGGNGYKSRLLTKNSTNDDENLVYRNAIQKIELGSNVTSIKTYAFAKCRLLSSITMPNTVTSIGDTAFGRECIALSNIVIPNSMTSIETNAFSSSYLSNIILPNSITSIGDSAFSSAYSLSNIIIPHSVTSIGSYLFQYTHTLANITIPNSVTTFGGGGQDFAKGIAFVDFASFSSIPPTEARYMFSSNNMASDYKIIVPDNLYEDWIVAWSGLASHIVKASDWV